MIEEVLKQKQPLNNVNDVIIVGAFPEGILEQLLMQFSILFRIKLTSLNNNGQKESLLISFCRVIPLYRIWLFDFLSE